MLKTLLSVLMICCALSLAAAPATAAEPYKHWTELSPGEQEALKPLQARWDTLPIKLQKHLLHAASRYPGLTPLQKKRFQNRLAKWSKLTPEQRTRAREKFKAFSKVPAAQREEVKKMVREQEAAQSAASGAPPAP